MAGSGRLTLFGAVDVLCHAEAAAIFNFYTDVPGSLALRHFAIIPATTGRKPVHIRLPATTKGQIYYPEIIPAGAFRLYGLSVWARVLPNGQWQWYRVPVIETGEWQAVKLPIEATGEWQAAKLPIPPTPEEWTPVKLPFKSTPETADWIPVEMDQ